MSLFNKLLKKKHELEKELANSKSSEKADEKEIEKETAAEIEETDTEEQADASVSDSEEVINEEFEDDEEYDDDEEITEEELQETINKVTGILMDNDYSEDETDDEELSENPGFSNLQEQLKQLRVEKSLFIAPVTKADDDLSAPLNDTVVHVSFNASKMIEGDPKPQNMELLVNLPDGYSLPGDDEPVTEMHLRTIVNANDNNTKWLPIFLNYQNFINMFKGTFRMQLVTFEEIYRFIDNVDGIVIEPGTINMLLTKKNKDQMNNQQDNTSEEK